MLHLLVQVKPLLLQPAFHPLPTSLDAAYGTAVTNRNSRTARADRFRAILGTAIIAVSVPMLFWWGTHFEIFGSEMDLIERPEQIGFFAFLLLGTFGAGFAAGGARTGLKAMAGFAALMLVAGLIGIIRRSIG